MTQKFQVGQTVLPAHPRGANPGSYVIVQVLPKTSHERQYRIKSLSSATECIVGETQIKRMNAEAIRHREIPPKYESERAAHLVWC
jgi:hypothetical protein